MITYIAFLVLFILLLLAFEPILTSQQKVYNTNFQLISCKFSMKYHTKFTKHELPNSKTN